MEINKPITLVREDFMNGVAKLVNDSGLPLFIIEDSLRYILNSVSELAIKQLEQDRLTYTQKIKTTSQIEDNKE